MSKRNGPIGSVTLSSLRQNITRCLKGAHCCRLKAVEAGSDSEEEAWLDLAECWTELAKVFEQADQPTLH
ncbi:hypothetical protein ABIE49_002550 [Bradyrhizobium sp. OAE829]